jgi:small multidrug resistance pump
MHPLIWLIAAIGSEVIATTSLKLSEGFSRPVPAAVVVIGYGISFYALAQSLRSIPLGVVYAVWSGIGTAVIALIGVWLFRETLDTPKVLGIALVIAGVALLNLVPGGRAA